MAITVDKSLLRPSGALDVEDLLDGKLLRKHVDAVLKAIDSVGDPIDRGDAFRGVLQIAMASIQIGMGFAATAAKRRNANALLAVILSGSPMDMTTRLPVFPCRRRMCFPS